MSIRKTQANNLKKGNYFMVDDEPCLVLSVEHSKSGKHGHAKNRVSCVGLFDQKKRSLVFSSGAMVDVPEIIKRSGQITSITENNVQMMDLESYLTVDAIWPVDDEIATQKLNDIINDPNNWGEYTAEYWDVVGKKMVTRVSRSS